MNRFLKLETIFFVFLFSLFFTLSLEANGSGSKRYRDSFSNAPDPDLEQERPVEKGKDDEKDDPGTKGGKTGKKKKKKTDISIPPGAGNEGSLVITLEAKSAQLTSFSNNGFSEPGAPVILDPDSLSPISSDRSLFDQVRGDFIREGGKVVVDKNGFVEGSFDPSIRQAVGITAGAGSKPVSFPPLDSTPTGFGWSKNWAAEFGSASRPIEDVGFLVMNPGNAVIAHAFPAAQPMEEARIDNVVRAYVSSVLLLTYETIDSTKGLTGWKLPLTFHGPAPPPEGYIYSAKLNKNYEFVPILKPKGEGVGWAIVEVGGLTAVAGIFGRVGLRYLKRVFGAADEIEETVPVWTRGPDRDITIPSGKPRPDVSRLRPLEIIDDGTNPELAQEVGEFIGTVGRNINALGSILDEAGTTLGKGDFVYGGVEESGQRVLYIVKADGEAIHIVDTGDNVIGRVEGKVNPTNVRDFADQAGELEVYDITGDYIEDLPNVTRVWFQEDQDLIDAALWFIRDYLFELW